MSYLALPLQLRALASLHKLITINTLGHYASLNLLFALSFELIILTVFPYCFSDDLPGPSSATVSPRIDAPVNNGKYFRYLHVIIETLLETEDHETVNQSSDDVELPSHIKLPILEMEKIEKVEAALKNKQTRKISVSYLCTE